MKELMKEIRCFNSTTKLHASKFLKEFNLKNCISNKELVTADTFYLFSNLVLCLISDSYTMY